MERIQFDSIVCKMWSEAPIEYSRESIERIFGGCVAPKIYVQALHLFDNQQLDATINLINRCFTAENDDRLHQHNEEV